MPKGRSYTTRSSARAQGRLLPDPSTGRCKVKRARWTVCLVVWSLGRLDHALAAPPSPRFDVRLLASAQTTPVDGRLIVVVSRNLEGEPRSQVSWGKDTQQVFAVDVEGCGRARPFASTPPRPGIRSPACASFPPERTTSRRFCTSYETFHRADGQVLKLPMDDGEGQEWSRSPGNLFSKPKQIAFDARSAFPLELTRSHPTHSRSTGHEVRPPDQRGERAALAFLGAAGVAAGDRPRA